MLGWPATSTTTGCAPAAVMAGAVQDTERPSADTVGAEQAWPPTVTVVAPASRLMPVPVMVKLAPDMGTAEGETPDRTAGSVESRQRNTTSCEEQQQAIWIRGRELHMADNSPR